MIKNVLAPEGARVSDIYSVFIKEDKDWMPVSVYMALTPDGSTNYVPLPLDILKEFNGFDHGTIALKTYFAGFDFSGEVQVKIVYNKEVSFFTFKPLNTDIDFKVNGNEVTFSINSPKKITIEPNGDIFGALTLFADALESEEKRKNMIYFPKGFYTSENCEYITIDEYGNPVIDGIEDNTLIYIDRGAVVNASYSEGQGYRIENVSFKNIEVVNAPEKMMTFFLKAPDMSGDYGISGITFDNIKINDKPISENNMLIVGNVSDIKII